MLMFVLWPGRPESATRVNCNEKCLCGMMHIDNNDGKLSFYDESMGFFIFVRKIQANGGTLMSYEGEALWKKYGFSSSIKNVIHGDCSAIGLHNEHTMTHVLCLNRKVLYYESNIHMQTVYWDFIPNAFINYVTMIWRLMKLELVLCL